MKKIYMLALALFCCATIINAQSQRMVFVEEFTQASCPPCETSTPQLNATLIANADKVVQLRYQTSWPGVDPMNEQNPVEVRDRVTYYGVTGVPNVFMNGATPTGVTFPTLISQANIDAAYATTAPIGVTVSHVLSDDLASMDITVSIENSTASAYSVASNRLRVAIVEEVIEFDSPPGSTSIVDFEFVMKSFPTGTAGVEIPEIAAGETWTNTWEGVSLMNTTYDMKHINVVAFVQDDADKVVVNGGLSTVQELAGDYPDLSIVDAGVSEPGYCDFNYTPGVSINNAGTIAGGYNVDLLIDGELIQSVSSTQDLAIGASETVSFDAVVLNPGANSVQYIATSPLGDLTTVGNETPEVTLSKASAAGAELVEDWEDEAPSSSPSNAAIESNFNDGLNFTIISAQQLGSTFPIGGFGMSDQSLVVNFWNWQSGSGSMTVLDQFTVSESAIRMLFDYAYTSWQGSNDQLKVEVSTDCGATFTTLFDESGSTLATAPEINQNNIRFIPSSADDWRNVEIDLAAYMGMDVMVRFAVVTAWGDMMYIDNIRTDAVSSNTELAEVKGLEIYPNPAQSYTTLSFDMIEAKEVTISVLDQLGRIVAVQDFGVLNGAQNIDFDISGLSNGIYMLKAQFDEEILVNKLSIKK